MSGFAGIVRLSGSAALAPEDARCAEQMARMIAFRGPDTNSVWRHADVHFCFSLLATNPAIQATTQPISLDGRVWLLGDVRLDGRDDLIRRFQQRGQDLASGVTDEELVLHVFHAFGENDVAELDGDYSLVLWDAKKKTLTAFRDLTGSKPFFYSSAGGILCFSNTLEALRKAPGFDGKLDESFLGDFLLASWCPDPDRTVYAQIRRLAPGFSLEFSQEGLRVKRAAQLPVEDLLRYKREEDYVEHYRDHLHRAVKDRLPCGETVVFMSGGLDSTTVAAEAVQICRASGGTHRVSAQAIDYIPLFDDREGEAAERVAEYLGIPFELLHGGNCEPFSGWDSPGLPLPEPNNEPFQALHVERHRRAWQNATVAFSGDGGDDVLLGHAWPYLRNLLTKGKVLTATWELTRQIWNTRKLPILGLGIRSGISRRFGQGTAKERFPEWISPEFAKRRQLHERFVELQHKPRFEHPHHPWPYAMLTGPFWPSLLEGEDAAWSGVPLQVRAPLLDRRMVRFLLRLPALPWCVDKQLARQAMAGRLPSETLSRPKTSLVQDPFALHWRKENGSCRPVQGLSAMVREMVDSARLENCYKGDDAAESLAVLRPFSLDRWLKSVEMSGRIQ